MRRFYGHLPDGATLYRIDKEGSLRFVYPPKENFEKGLWKKDYSRETYFQEAGVSGNAAISKGTSVGKEEKCLILARPIYIGNGKGGKEFDGIIACCMNLETLTARFVTPVVSGRTGYVWAIDNFGIFMAHNREDFIGKSAFDARPEADAEISFNAINRIQKQMLDGKAGVGSYLSGWHRERTGEIEKLIAYFPIPVFERTWSVAVCAPVDEVDWLLKDILREEKQATLFILAILMAAGACAFVILYRWSRSIQDADKALRVSEKNMRNIIESSPIGIRIVQNGRYIYVNPAFIHLFGHDRPDEILGRPVEDLYAPECLDMIKKRGKDRLAGKDVPPIYEARLIRKDGRIFDGMICVTGIETNGAPAVLGFFVDISKEKKLRKQLLESQKLEAISTLAGGIAHEFNNALCAVMGNIDLLQMHFSENEKEAKHITSIRTSTHHMAHLTSQLLAYAEGGQYNPRIISLSRLVEDALPLIRHLVPPDIQLETDLEEGHRQVRVDPAQMQMAISALLANAAEAITETGHIRIRVGNFQATEKTTTINPDCRPGPYACFWVKDDGKGMKQDTLDRLFDPFFTTKFQGRGLSMAAVYGIVKNHNGWISVDSRWGEGTEICICLPIPTTAIEADLS